MTITDLRLRLQNVKGGDRSFTARCPSHDDRRNSLSVSLGDGGKLLLRCHAGCHTEDVCGALGLTLKDLMPERDRPAGNPIVATYIYTDVDGKHVAKKHRKADKGFLWEQPGGVWKKPDVPLLYNATALHADTIFIVEGEKDVETMRRLGYPTVSPPNGAKSWPSALNPHFQGKTLFIIPDNDKQGWGLAEQVAGEMQGIASTIKLLDLRAMWREVPEKGDVSDLAAAKGDVETKKYLDYAAKHFDVWEPRKAAQEKSPALLMPMSQVEAKRAEYLIAPYLPRGMLAIIGGISGAGKTYLVLSWAAAISKGERLPFQSPFVSTPPQGYVYYFTQENDPNTVIRPRLDLLGADLSHVLIQNQTGSTYDQLTLNDPRLEEAAKTFPPALVIFDPIQSYLGAGVEMNKANEVRPILDWLGDYAKRHQCAVVLVSHMSKPGAGSASALDRLLGSSDFRNAARSIVVVGRDPEDKETRVFAHGKNSIGVEGESQRYHIDGSCGVIYDGPCDLTAEDIVAQGQQKGRNKPAVTLTETMRQLEELLGEEGFATAEQIDTLQISSGVSHGTMVSARKELGLQRVSIGRPPHRKTWWLFPDVNIDKFKFDHTPAPEQTAI